MEAVGVEFADLRLLRWRTRLPVSRLTEGGRRPLSGAVPPTGLRGREDISEQNLKISSAKVNHRPYVSIHVVYEKSLVSTLTSHHSTGLNPDQDLIAITSDSTVLLCDTVCDNMICPQLTLAHLCLNIYLNLYYYKQSIGRIACVSNMHKHRNLHSCAALLAKGPLL